MCTLHRNCNRLPGAPDARKRPAMCASAHEQAADKADRVPGERLHAIYYRIEEEAGVMVYRVLDLRRDPKRIKKVLAS